MNKAASELLSEQPELRIDRGLLLPLVSEISISFSISSGFLVLFYFYWDIYGCFGHKIFVSQYDLTSKMLGNNLNINGLLNPKDEENGSIQDDEERNYLTCPCVNSIFAHSIHSEYSDWDIKTSHTIIPLIFPSVTTPQASPPYLTTQQP